MEKDVEVNKVQLNGNGEIPPASGSDKHTKELVTYYVDTGLDYGEWSREYNMHFGYYRFPMNPFIREPMLEEMNKKVFENLHLDDDDFLIYDLGCGLGATCRSFARKYPAKKIKGVTLVKWQIEKANTLNLAAGLNSNIELILDDYTKMPFKDNSADAVFALESCCQCEGLDKASFVKEMLRVLKPGKRFVIVDGFIKKKPESFRGLLRYCYNEICKGWVLPSFPHIGMVSETIKNSGGENIETKDFSFRVAPSAFHAPFAVVYFLIKKLLKGEKLNAVRLNHLKSCFLGLILGMFRHNFCYSIITGNKKEYPF